MGCLTNVFCAIFSEGRSHRRDQQPSKISASRRRHQQNHSATGDRRSCDHQKTPQLFVSLWAIAIIAAVTGKIISAVANVFCSIFPKGDRDVATGGKIPSTASRRHRANRRRQPPKLPSHLLAVPRVSLAIRSRPQPRTSRPPRLAQYSGHRLRPTTAAKPHYRGKSIERPCGLRRIASARGRLLSATNEAASQRTQTVTVTLKSRTQTV